MPSILTLHGPNLNSLGSRETALYGSTTLIELNCQLADRAQALGHTLYDFQSNSEEKLINRIYQAQEDKNDFIIFNPAAFTHTSIALRDALLSVAIPFIEVHVSNIYGRESFRQHSYFSDIALGTITGLGINSYFLALQHANHYLNEQRSTVSRWTCEKSEN